MSTIVVPQGFAYASAAILSTSVLVFWQHAVVAKARGRAGIKYPQPYAEKAEVEASKEALIFNCAQRAHMNTLETLPIILVTTSIMALKYPIPAAACCGLWSFSRILYTLGYATGEPAKRRRGNVGYIGILGLFGGAAYTVYDLLVAGV